MGIRVYLPLAALVFVAATTGADVFASMSLAGQSFGAALHENLYWAAAQSAATLLLLAPFAAVAFVCARVEKDARTRTVLFIFAVAMLTLLYFYFEGYQAAERAELKHMWTAATMSIAVLPFLIGLPVVLAVIAAGYVAAKFDRRASV